MTNWTKWQIQSPYATLTVGGIPPEEVFDALGHVPGAKQRKNQWDVPENAVPTFLDAAGVVPGLNITAVAWRRAPKPEPSWGEVEKSLRSSGELREFVLSGFLMDYQREAICFAWRRSGVHFWHTVGSGKTLSGICASLAIPGTVVIVTRASTRIQYGREIERFTHCKSFVVQPASYWKTHPLVRGESYAAFTQRVIEAGGDRKMARGLWQKRRRECGVDPIPQMEDAVKANLPVRTFVIVSWESLPDLAERLCALRPATVIFDESHNGKSPKRYRTQALFDLPEDPEALQAQVAAEAKLAADTQGFIKDTENGRVLFIPLHNIASSAATLGRAAQRRIATTATPIRDRTRDLWSQLDLVDPNAWGNSTVWRKRYSDMRPGTYGGMDDRGASNLEELKARLNFVAHILPYERTHKMLPPKRRVSMYISEEEQCEPLPGLRDQRRHSRTMSPSMRLELELAISASKKRKAIISLIADHLESDQKVTVFTGRRRDCEEIAKIVQSSLQPRYSNCQVWTAHGEDSTVRRQEVMDEYMAASGPCVLVSTGHSMGEGVNLQDTDAALFVQLPVTPGQLRQWEGRFSRHGQKRPVIVYFVIAEGTVDERIASILIDKLPAVEDVAKDTELGSAKEALSGVASDMTDEDFVASVMAKIDLDGEEEEE